MKRWLPVLLVLAQAGAHGADILPRALAGTWGTAETLFDGTQEQLFAYLATDGAAAVIGSGRAPARGSADGTAAAQARPVIGFPATARLDGDTLTLRPFVPGKQAAPPADELALRCRYDAAAVTLACAGPDGVRHVLRYRGAGIPANAAGAMATVRKR